MGLGKTKYKEKWKEEMKNGEKTKEEESPPFYIQFPDSPNDLSLQILP